MDKQKRRQVEPAQLDRRTVSMTELRVVRAMVSSHLFIEPARPNPKATVALGEQRFASFG